MTDGAQQELSKLESFSNDGKSRWPTVNASLDSILATLNASKDALSVEGHSDSGWWGLHTLQIIDSIDRNKRGIEERQKEVYNAIGRLGKALDKKFTNPLPVYDSLPFASQEAIQALENVLTTHFLRTGQFGTASVFLGETSYPPDPELTNALRNLHEILADIKIFKFDRAIRWSETNHVALQHRNCSLEFNLHKLQYLRLVLDSSKSNKLEALQYLQQQVPIHVRQQHSSEIHRLITALIFLPLERLKTSPYADILDDQLHRNIQEEFVKEYCASIHLSRALPLRVASDIGAGGAITRIEKGKKLMREKKGEWSQINELHIEVPLPPELRYHSIFACPVSKEQSTESNHPMMMTCGHVLAKDSLTNMVKGGGRLKCPYCPELTTLNACVRVCF